jgi:hypothetical protein
MNTEFYAALLGAIVGGIAATIGGVGLGVPTATDEP